MARWCDAGANHIWLRQDNVMQLCCSLDSNVKEHRVKLQTPAHFLQELKKPEHIQKYKVLETQGLPGGLCDICTDKERVYGDSQRLKINRITGGNKFFLKIDFSNKCNLKCVMCHSKRSTAWIKDEQRMNAILPKNMQIDIDSYNSLRHEWWYNIPVEWWQNLGAVEISGGEPLYQEDALAFMDYLSRAVPTCWLRIITNATLVNDDTIEMIDRFERVFIMASVDAWQDDVYRYSRGDHYSIEHVKENIKRLLRRRNVKMAVTDTVHPMTYDQADLGRQWVESLGARRISYNSQKVYTPHHLDVDKVLPRSFNPKSSEDKELQIYFYKWISALDKVRGTNVLNIRPEFTEWFNEIQGEL